MPAAQLEDVETADDGTRYYSWSDGERYPSVTTITGSSDRKKRMMEAWAEDHPNPEQYRDRQGMLGSFMHHRILNELSIRELPPPELDTDLLYDGFQDDLETAVMMWERVDIDPGRSPRVEEPVRHDELEYAGRFDLLTEDGLVCDLKVSQDAFRSHKQQASAYYHAVTHMGEYDDPRGACIIVLHPHRENNPSLTPTVYRLSESELEHRFDQFKSLLRSYKDANRQ